MNFEPAPRSTPGSYAIASWLGIAVLFLFHMLRLSHDLVHPDVAWYLYGTEQMLKGAALYRDIVDINPPLIYLLNVPPVWLAGILGLPSTAVFKVFVLLMVFGSLVLCNAILSRVMHSSTSATRSVVLFMISFVLLPVAAGNFGYIGTSFGQREHLMTTLTIPYILAGIGRAQRTELPGWLSLLVGVLAGIGLSIKPHFTLLWVAIEVYLVVATRNPSLLKNRGNVIIASILGVYWIAVVVFFQEYTALVFKVIQTYGAYDATFEDLIIRQPVGIWLLAGGVLVLMRSHPTYKQARLILYLAGSALLLVALLQRKGWGYQFYPARAILIASIGFTFAVWVEHLEQLPRTVWWRRVRWGGVVATVMLIGAAKPAVEAMIGSASRGIVPSLLPIVQQHAEGKNVILFSTTLDPQFPLVNYAGVDWSSRYPELWFLPHFYAGVSVRTDGTFPYHTPSEMGSLEREFFGNVIADLLNKPPELLMSNIAEGRYPMERSRFSFIDYYTMDPRFATLFAEYRLIATINHFAIYKRQPMDVSLTYFQQ